MSTSTQIVMNKVSTAGKMRKEDEARFEEFRVCAGMSFKKHQLDGVMWCLNNERIGVETLPGTYVRGGLIADEMGLGKTFQMLSTMICNFKLHTLVVLPLILLDQWANAIQKTTGYSPLVYHGVDKKTITLDDLKREPIVITTYGMISLDIADTKGKAKSLLHMVKWNRVVFDEAHHLRNHKNNVFYGARRLKSEIKWLITGTPIQNRKNDFYSLCSVMGLPADYYTNDENIMALVKGFILRRTKADADIELPMLVDKTEIVAWNTETGEKQIAENIHAKLRFANMEIGAGNQIAMFDDTPLVSLLRARQVCILPNMLSNRLIKKKKMHAIEADEDDVYKSENWYLYGLKTSSKLDAVINKIIERKANGKRKLMFCHYRQEIDVIAHRLRRQDMNVVTFDGRTSMSMREVILTSCSIDVLILQIQTGCEGLNLQQFSEIYFVSPHWNPAIEDQAVARCHRIGQTEPVNVFRFHMSCFDEEMENSSLDVYSSQVQEFKRSIMKELEDASAAAAAANPQDIDV
jgi:SNF2 family DNA or RNA helicase